MPRWSQKNCQHPRNCWNIYSYLYHTLFVPSSSLINDIKGRDLFGVEIPLAISNRIFMIVHFILVISFFERFNPTQIFKEKTWSKMTETVSSHFALVFFSTTRLFHTSLSNLLMIVMILLVNLQVTMKISSRTWKNLVVMIVQVLQMILKKCRKNFNKVGHHLIENLNFYKTFLNLCPITIPIKKKLLEKSASRQVDKRQLKTSSPLQKKQKKTSLKIPFIVPSSSYRKLLVHYLHQFKIL